MIAFLLRGLCCLPFGYPWAFFGAGAGLAALFACRRDTCCLTGCKLRDIACCKWLLRCLGLDSFADFDLTVHIQDVDCQTPQDIGKFCVSLTAGGNQVRSQHSSKGLFHTSLTIHVEQGTRAVFVDLLTKRDLKLASLKLPVALILSKRQTEGLQEQHFELRPQSKAVQHARMRMMFVSVDDQDCETASTLVFGDHPDSAWLVAKQLRKAEAEVQLRGSPSRRESLSEIEVLMQACRGPLDLFDGFWSDSARKFAAVVGPPKTRRFLLCFWLDDDRARPLRGRALHEIDLMRVTSVHLDKDPHRSNIFIIQYLNEHRLSKQLICRIVDRPASIWVETFRMLIGEVKDRRDSSKRKKKDGSSRTSSASSTSAEFTQPPCDTPKTLSLLHRFWGGRPPRGRPHQMSDASSEHSQASISTGLSEHPSLPFYGVAASHSIHFSRYDGSSDSENA